MSYVALLRGINLGKVNKVDMKSLRSLFEQMGFQNVRSYIQTGNILFDNYSCDEQQIEVQLKQTYGFDIPVTIRTKEELNKVQQHPLFNKDHVYIVFLKHSLSHEQFELLQTTITDEFDVLNQKTIIIDISAGHFHQTKYNNAFFERKLQIPSTLRNRNTVDRILSKM
ncbi:DUF1697 domain-containing protein [Paucisalibacillus globulus]|uniref:DUF1697 domain-containing protein n=1 Tax=Paucisalibacillus globulus TaxID=351095 RepID=UPI0004286ECE|nr:DUF1697 domain-containing protein [Paucisalibacillus globulus]